MKKFPIQVGQFETLVAIIRQSPSNYAEIVKNFDSFKVVDNCFSVVSSACCQKRALLNKDCSEIFKAFALDKESNQGFFDFFKTSYGFEEVSILEHGVVLASY